MMLNDLQFGFDAAYGGNGKIGSFALGAVTRADGEPVETWVLIYATLGPLVGRVRSNAVGSWEAPFLNESLEFTARIYDPERQLNGAVLDWIQPVPM